MTPRLEKRDADLDSAKSSQSTNEMMEKKRSFGFFLTYAAAMVILITSLKLLFEGRQASRILTAIRNTINLWQQRQNIQRHELQRQRCDHDNWKEGYISASWWREDLHDCVTYDLSLRSKPLQDAGVARLVDSLSDSWYLGINKRTGKRRRQLQSLDLSGNELTSKGAAILARWISTDPVAPNDSALNKIRGAEGSTLSEPERIPTALRGTRSRPFVLHIENNPILARGRQVLERAVDRALEHHVHVVVYGGGVVEPQRQNILKVGPVVLTLGAPKLAEKDTQTWQYPPTLKTDFLALSIPVLYFFFGTAFGLMCASNKRLKRYAIKMLKIVFEYQNKAIKWLINSVDSEGPTGLGMSKEKEELIQSK